MKPSIPILIFVLFVSLSINSFAEWISEGAIVDQFGVGNSSHHWSGTVHVQTAVDYMLESNPGTQAIFAPINNQVIAANGVHKQGSRVLYPGDILQLRADVFNPVPNRYNIATSTIYVNVPGAVY